MRFIARKEEKLSIFLDTMTGKIFKLNPLSFELLELLSHTPEALTDRISSHKHRDIFLYCLEKMIDIGILNQDMSLNTELIIPKFSGSVLSAPVRVYLNLTNRCNLSCKHCVNLSGPKETSELSSDIIKSLVEEMSRIGVFELIIGGGEPLLHPDILDIIRLVNSKRISTGITTNGLVVNENMAKKLSKLNFNYLSVSLDGATRSTHEHIRGKGSFSGAIMALKNLKKYTSHRISIHFVIMKHNLSELPALFRLAEELKCDIGLDFIRAAGKISDYPELLIDRNDYFSCLDLLFNRLMPDASVKVILPERYYPWTVDIRLYGNFGCGAANTCCGVDSEGYVFPCNFIPAVESLDNLKDKSLQEIWLENKEFNRLRSLQANKICSDCIFLASCRGGCRANVPSSLCHNAPDPYCIKDTESYSPDMKKFFNMTVI